MIAGLQYAWRGWFLGALFAALAWARWKSQAPLLPAGLIPVVCGMAYRLNAGRFIPGHSNSLRLAGDALALGGPYRFGRHPLYLSNLSVIAGLILFANSLPFWGAALLLALACAHHAALARTEEGFLSRSRGEPYLRYLRATPRWLGFPRPEDASRAESWAEAATGSAPAGTGLAAAWKRQGANLGKTAACVLVLWLLALLPR